MYKSFQELTGRQYNRPIMDEATGASRYHQKYWRTDHYSTLSPEKRSTKTRRLRKRGRNGGLSVCRMGLDDVLVLAGPEEVETNETNVESV